MYKKTTRNHIGWLNWFPENDIDKIMSGWALFVIKKTNVQF